VDAFERGRGPEICFLSGERTADRIKVTAENRDAYVWLLFFGIVPYVVVRLLTRRTSRGSIGLSEDVYGQIKERRMNTATPYLAAAAGIVPGFLLQRAAPLPGLAAIAVGVIAGCALAIVARRRDPIRGIHLDDAGRWVIVPNAADAYADAVDADLRSGGL